MVYMTKIINHWTNYGDGGEVYLVLAMDSLQLFDVEFQKACENDDFKVKKTIKLKKNINVKWAIIFDFKTILVHVVRNFYTPFHMKICNSQNSFGGGTTM